MKLQTFISIFFIAVLISSCSSLKKPSSSSFDDSDSPYVTDELKPKVKPEVKKIVVKEEKVKMLEIEKEQFKYYVIIGSFRILDNAKNYKQQLIKEGFTPVLMENENGLYRVSVAAYNDEQAARNKIAEIRSKYEKYSDVWLLIRKY
ncbi:MAG: SPOR domain-containing protein [Chlorobi bacterium]|nr:SPOR domain-containing protein [Chlorobiota bacterium]